MILPHPINSMKALFTSLSLLALLAFFFAPEFARSQDMPPPPLDGAIPPPPDQGAPPPPPDQGGPQDQGAPPDDQGASFQTFYDQLGDQGSWIQTDDYGYVFQPNVSDPNWAPYTQGHWVYTDAGWTWASDEPWGWATYHYGRWANIDGTGWVWVPGYRWAPAWVSWRYGGGYAGWAPLPPETMVGAEYGDGGGDVGIGFHFGGDVDVSFHIGAGCYNFVHVGDLGENDYHDHYVDRSTNYTVINRTTNITNINVTNNYGSGPNAGHGFRGVSAGGPSINAVNAQSPRHVPTVHLTEANQPGQSREQGNSLAVFAPRVNPATLHQAKPSAVAQTLNHPTFNRGDSIAKPLAVNAHVSPPPPTPLAIQQAQDAQQHAPSHAKIATEQTPIKMPLNKPITSLAPVNQAPRSVPTSPNPGEVHANGGNPSAQHNPGNTPFTGETVKPHVASPTAPAQTYHQPPVNPSTQHEAAPFTGSSTSSNAAQEQARQQAQLQAREAQAHQQAQQQQVHQQQQAQPQYHQPQQPQAQQQQAPQFHQQQQAPHAAPPPPAFHSTAPAPQSHPAPPPPAQHPSSGNNNSGNSGNGNPNDKNKPQGQ